MQKFLTFEAPAAPLPQSHVDTDQILPARYMTTTSRHGLGKGLFAEARYDAEGRERPDFVLNRPKWRGAGILIAYENFGCGSSREHAPWALLDFGLRCVIAPSFGDIFRINSVKNGLLLATLPRTTCEELVEASDRDPGRILAVDLVNQIVRTPEGHALEFTIAPRERDVLLRGLDDITRSLRHETEIAAYEAAR